MTSLAILAPELFLEILFKLTAIILIIALFIYTHTLINKRRFRNPKLSALGVIINFTTSLVAIYFAGSVLANIHFNWNAILYVTFKIILFIAMAAFFTHRDKAIRERKPAHYPLTARTANIALCVFTITPHITSIDTISKLTTNIQTPEIPYWIYTFTLIMACSALSNTIKTQTAQKSQLREMHTSAAIWSIICTITAGVLTYRTA